MTRALPPFRRALQRATPALALGTAVLTAALAACADTPTGPAAPAAPSAASVAASGARLDAKLVAPTARRSGVTAQTQHGDTLVSTLVLQPDGAWVAAALGGGHTITFPAGAASVCDPRTSSYGAGTWDAPCAPSRDSVVITALTWLDHGVPRVEFSPALRFVPTPGATPGAGVQLALKNPHAKFTGTANRIDYCPALAPAAGPAPAKGCVDESAADPSVATVTTPNGFWQRRVKHFSGYTVVVN